MFQRPAPVYASVEKSLEHTHELREIRWSMEETQPLVQSILERGGYGEHLKRATRIHQSIFSEATGKYKEHTGQRQTSTQVRGLSRAISKMMASMLLDRNEELEERLDYVEGTGRAVIL